MKFSYAVIIRRTRADEIGNEMRVPLLGMHRELKEPAHKRIQAEGMVTFLEKTILRTLRERDARGQRIPVQSLTNMFMETYAHLINPQRPMIMNPHDLTINVEGEFKPLGCHCCASVFPTLMKFTILVEMACGTIIQIGTMELADGFLPMAKKQNEDLSISLAVIGVVFKLWNIFLGPTMMFMTDMGDSVDAFFYRRCHQYQQLPEPMKLIPDEKKSSWSRIDMIVKGVQALFLMMTFAEMWGDATQDYEQFILLSTALEGDHFLPNWLINAAMWISFVLNQLNDPVQAFTMCFYGFQLISAYLKGAPSAAVVEEALVEDKEEDYGSDDERDEKMPVIIHSSPAPSLRVFLPGRPQQRGLLFAPAAAAAVNERTPLASDEAGERKYSINGNGSKTA